MKISDTISANLRAALLGVACLLAGGCADDMCDPKPLPEPWKAYQTLLPGNVVVCGENRFRGGKTKDTYPPTQLFVYYKDGDPRDAFLATTKKFETDGWKFLAVDTFGEGNDAVYDAKFEKAGVTISLTVNRNDAGVQGGFSLSPTRR